MSPTNCRLIHERISRPIYIEHKHEEDEQTLILQNSDDEDDNQNGADDHE